MLLDTQNGGSGGDRWAFIGVDYDEFKPESFRGLYVTLPGPFKIEEPRFQTLRAAAEYAYRNGADSVHLLSDYDHFISDGGSVPEQ